LIDFSMPIFNPPMHKALSVVFLPYFIVIIACVILVWSETSNLTKFGIFGFHIPILFTIIDEFVIFASVYLTINVFQ